VSHVAHIRNSYTVIVIKPEGKGPLGSSRRRRGDTKAS
jgi:hypothetical protein